MVEKRKVQDVVPPESRSIRRLAVEKKPTLRRRPAPIVEEEKEIPIVVRRAVSSVAPERNRSTSTKRYVVPQDYVEDSYRGKSTPSSSWTKRAVLLFSFFAACALIFAAFSLIYAKAYVKISPKETPVTLEKSYIAKKQALAGELQYEVMTLSKEATTTVEGSLGDTVSTKAKGTVVLYNNYSNTPQTIVAKSRLENTKGLVYLTDYAVVIPAKKTVGGKVVAGSIGVTVTAAEPGAGFNTALGDLTGDFTFPAFKSGPKYTTVYGRLKTALTGGYSGKKLIVAADDLKSAEAALKNIIVKELLAQAKVLAPVEYIVFPTAYTSRFEPLSQKAAGQNTVELHQKGYISAILFKKDLLMRYVAEKDIEPYKGNYELKNIENLVFQLLNTQDFNPDKGTALNFSLKGALKIVGTFPGEAIAKDLAGKGLTESSAVFAKYATIAKADVVMKPFWKRSFPGNPARISIENTSATTKQ